jgi:hypothetical protein
MTRVLASLCLAAAAASLVACGGDDNGPTASSSPSPTPTPTPASTGCTQTTLATATRALTWNILDTTPFTTTQAGRVDVTVDWRDAGSNVGAYVVEAGTCTAQRFNNGNCSFLVSSGGDKPHQLSANLPAGAYELLLQNFGGGRSSSETATAQIVESTGDCPAS